MMMDQLVVRVVKKMLSANPLGLVYERPLLRLGEHLPLRACVKSRENEPPR